MELERASILTGTDRERELLLALPGPLPPDISRMASLLQRLQHSRLKNRVNKIELKDDKEDGAGP